MSGLNVKINDTVLVITGKYVGKTGKVRSTSPKKGTVVVEGINIQRKAKKARKANEVSQFVEQEGPIDASNVMVICPSCGKATRVRHDVTGEKKVRICAKCGAVLDKAFAGKNAKAGKKDEPKRRERKRDRKRDKKAEDASKAE